MLQIKNICKKYITGDLTQTALDNVSLNLRDNEFVAILGPSGSGKTTLLNIIGGLDRYDRGDLIINGISTKKYKDRDWDSYRNHTIGFVFQSYNLIPHQSVLANVELALTISGISRGERRKRAKKALEEVGLGNQLHKRPNQMSGGQMQRVAIARALVNDPDILLADEPTGALDTETSIQVMNLLKEVAKDRLVVMVTHNPELAEEYATRIVKLRDGKIIDDSDSFTPDAKGLKAPEHKNMGKSSMSFLTSLALSFNNLRTKKGRTILTAFAGSIGIIGIALILSLSNGVNTYIKHVEEDTLSEYPLAIQNKNIDITSFMERMGVIKEENSDAEVRELQTLSSVFSQISSNDLKSFKAYLEDSNSGVMKYANAVEYTYNVAPHIYRVADDGSYRQVNPDQTFAALSGGASMQMSGMNPMMSMDVFMPLPENEKLYREQYEVMAGRWPENHNECVLVLSADGRVLDLVLYAVGFKDSSELDKMIELYFKGEDINITSEPGTFKYKDFIDISFKLADATDYYEYDDNYDVFVDKKDNKQYMKNLLKNGEDLTIVGVVKPESSSGAAMLSGGIYYHNSLIDYIIEQNKDSEIVGKQLENPEVDVFTGKKFSDAKEGSAMDLSSLFSIDEEALKKAFDVDSDMMNFDPSMFEGMDFSSMDMSGLQFDLSGMDFSSIDMSGLNFDNVTPAPDMQGINLEDMLKNISVDISSEEMQKMFGELVNGYMAEAAKDPSTDYSKLGEALGQYLRSDNARTIIRSEVEDVLSGVAQALPKTQTVTDMISDIMSGLPGYIEEKGAEDISLLPAYINEYLNTVEVQAKINSFVEDINAKLSEAGLSEEELAALMNRLYQGYEDYSLENELPQPSKLMDSFTAYLGSDAGRSILSEGIQKAVNTEEISKQFEKSFAQVMSGYGDAIQKQMGSAMSDMAGQISSEIQKQMTSVMGQLSSEISRQMADSMQKMAESMQGAFSFDAEAFKDAINPNMNADEFSELMMSMMSVENSTYEGNLRKLNYADADEPYAISIYPKDFDSKNSIIELIDSYNTRMENDGDEDKVISYTDYVGTLMSSVTDIIDTISYVLIAFVAISLIVSSIMIGIITYISVLERTKEIGILRAIGASKRNISQVFNAETFIIGLLAGVIGIGTALLLLILGNMIIHAVAGNNDVSAILPFWGAVILVIISVILTLIGGLIPSKKAAKKDPVTALRTE